MKKTRLRVDGRGKKKLLGYILWASKSPNIGLLFSPEYECKEIVALKNIPAHTIITYFNKSIALDLKHL